MNSTTNRLLAGLNRVGPIPTGLVVITWTLLLPKLIPVPVADYGMFLSVAERLRAGDTLYVEVFENKDPLFHYSLAASTYLGSFGPWILQIVWVLLAGVAAFKLAGELGLPVRSSVLAGFALTPLIMTGVSFFAGSSHMPAVTIVLWSLVTAMRGYAVSTGILIALLGFFKLVMLPLGVIVLVAAAWYRRSWSWGIRSAIAGVATGAFIAAVMAIRGELLAYLESLVSNVEYSQAAGGGGGTLAAIQDHLTRVLNTGNLVALWTSLALLLLVFALIRKASAGETPADKQSWLAAVMFVFLAYALVAIALTGLWGHHGLILKPVAVVSLLLFMSSAPAVVKTAQTIALPALLAITYLLAGLPAPAAYLDPLLFARANVNLQFVTPTETQLILDSGEPTTYARVGDGDDRGHAMGLREWTLACPRFGQSIWESETILQSTMDCLPGANVILITDDVQRTDAYPLWNNFLDQLDTLVEEEYECSSGDGGRVCRRLGT